MTVTENVESTARNPWTAPYWEGVARRELLYQHCTSCQRNVFPARRFCPYCASPDFEWRESGGRGRIYSFSVLERGAIAAFAAAAPYAIAIVELDEGFRITSRIEGSPFESLRCDLPVEVSFDHLHSGLPSFVLSATA